MTKVNGIFLKAQFEPTWASVVLCLQAAYLFEQWTERCTGIDQCA